MCKNNAKNFDIIVIGAGAAGLFSAIFAAKRGKKVLLIEHTSKIAEKIRISGGGRCNFTNLNAAPNCYQSLNKHFVKSALARYTQHDFIELVKSYNISFHEKTLGQLFCDNSSNDIINMLVNECKKYGADILPDCKVEMVTKSDDFSVQTNKGEFTCKALIVATGGLSIPKIGASSFGYDIAKQFGHSIVKLRPALVPLIVEDNISEFCKNLAGVSIYSIAKFAKTEFEENILFTHQGLTGPAILQISSYIDPVKDAELSLNLLPEYDMAKIFAENKNSKLLLTNFLKNYLPTRFVENWCGENFEIKAMTDYKVKYLAEVAEKLHNFRVRLKDTVGYSKAEVTAGGVNTDEISSKTMESLKVKNLYFIGEVVDVTGMLGGYNFQWAWSSGFVAGNAALT